MREYQTQDGNRERKIGPFVFWILDDYLARWQTYRWRVWRYQKNKPSQGSISRNFIDGEVGQSIRREREPLADANLTEKEIKVILKMPGVKKRRYKAYPV